MSAGQDPSRLSVERYKRMIEMGALGKYDKVELIRGQLVLKMPIDLPHAACTTRLNRQFVLAVNDRAIVGVKSPVELADSMPEPDVSILAPSTDFYATASPKPRDVFLVIEAASVSLDFDREVKKPLYAENGITEYWIANVIDRVLEVYRQPRPDGTYADVRVLRPGDMADIAALHGLTVSVADIF